MYTNYMCVCVCVLCVYMCVLCYKCVCTGVVWYLYVCSSDCVCVLCVRVYVCLCVSMYITVHIQCSMCKHSNSVEAIEGVEKSLQASLHLAWSPFILHMPYNRSRPTAWKIASNSSAAHSIPSNTKLKA